MKHDDAHAEIAALLRSQKPGTVLPTGLEGRILRELDRQQQRPAARPWMWLVAPAAIAALFIVLGSLPPQKSSNSTPREARQERAPKEEDSPIIEANPLNRESLALTRDARRAGRFLIDCLPSPGNGFNR